jgi:hypothetical protein
MALWVVLTNVEQGGRLFWPTVLHFFIRVLDALRGVRFEQWSRGIAIKYEDFLAQREWSQNMIKKKAANQENGLGRVVGPGEGPATMVSRDHLIASLRPFAELDDLLLVEQAIQQVWRPNQR